MQSFFVPPCTDALPYLPWLSLQLFQFCCAYTPSHRGTQGQVYRRIGELTHFGRSSKNAWEAICFMSDTECK
ncbi:hypothetical protein BZA77DRAFT_325823 [Pyronema omphalodes]|nr:hypothetical protein BZA77DRAFT_325823 [Pyronema omphalodes]